MKKKSKNWLYIITIVIAILIFVTSIGYAFFRESLTINGVASTVEYYEGTKLPTTPVILDNTYNRYQVSDIHKDWLDFGSESWVGDTYTSIWNKRTGIIVGEKTITYKIAFINNTELTMTDGQITSETISNQFSYLKKVSANLSKTTVKPGEQVEINYVITSNFPWAVGNHEVKATISYMLQNKRRYMYYIIKYVPDY